MSELASNSVNGIVNVLSQHSVAETIDQMEMLAKDRGMTIFARIDQRLEAEKAGLTLRPMQLLIFGNPKAGTLLLQQSASIAIDLPLKAVAWQDEAGQVWISYNNPAWLQSRHHLSDELTEKIAGIVALVTAAAH